MASAGTLSRHRIVVVGCGAVARHGHLPALCANRRVEVAALCDPSREARDDLARRFGLDCPTFTSMHEALESVDAESVDICAPGPTHDGLVEEALQAGTNVLVEKPPASSLASAQRLAALARKRGLKLGTVFNYRLRDVMVGLREAVEAGMLGRIRKVHIVHHGCCVFSEAPWLWDEARSRYLLCEFGIHFLDTMVDLCGRHRRVLWVHPVRQQSVKLTTEVELGVEFEDGAIGTLDMVADSTRGSSYFTHISVFGTAMDAFIRFFPPLIRFAAGLHNPIEVVSHELKAFVQLGVMLALGRYKAYRNLPHKRTLDMFCDWVTEGKPYPFELSRVMPTLELLEDLQQHIPGYAARPAASVAVEGSAS